MRHEHFLAAQIYAQVPRLVERFRG